VRTATSKLADGREKPKAPLWEDWRRKLAEDNQPLVRFTLASMRLDHHRRADDLVGEGMAALTDSARLFDASRGVKFSTYCVWAIRRRIAHAVERFGRQDRELQMIDGSEAAIVSDREAGALEVVLASELALAFCDAMQNLSERCQRVIIMIYFEGRKFADVGAELHISPEYARKLRKIALAQLRENAFLASLAEGD
jgi:RNA polymerase sigma factor (sigma-70 family)